MHARTVVLAHAVIRVGECEAGGGQSRDADQNEQDGEEREALLAFRYGAASARPACSSICSATASAERVALLYWPCGTTESSRGGRLCWQAPSPSSARVNERP